MTSASESITESLPHKTDDAKLCDLQRVARKISLYCLDENESNIKGHPKRYYLKRGKELVLIDAIVPPKHLLKVSRKWALDIAKKLKPWVRSIDRTNKIGSQSDAQQIINAERQKFIENRPLHQAC
ncbi:crotonase [Artemisia annua]|uniref:Crotonase n=1 Tax=Artemisia annua TaxID=35608 RepID=A0A2U1NK76_ARTAN|nr:crotonase [Artemisia annua]